MFEAAPGALINPPPPLRPYSPGDIPGFDEADTPLEKFKIGIQILGLPFSIYSSKAQSSTSQ